MKLLKKIIRKTSYITVLLLLVCILLTIVNIQHKNKHEYKLDSHVKNIELDVLDPLTIYTDVEATKIDIVFSSNLTLEQPKVETLYSNTTYYDVPLSIEIQDFVNTVCTYYNISPVIIYQIVHTESRFNRCAYSGVCYGLMQIHPAFIDELIGWGDLFDTVVGSKIDLYNEKQNILLGIRSFVKHLKYAKQKGYSNITVAALEMYNHGAYGWEKLNEKNKYQCTHYADVALKVIVEEI